MAAITKLSQKAGTRYRVTINMAGVRPFSRNFKTKKAAVPWAKRTEGDLEAARVEGNNAARYLTLSDLITELVNSRTINPATVIALTWWKDNYGHELCLLFDKSAVRNALKCLANRPAFRGEHKRTNATINRYKASLSTAFEYGREEYDLPGNPCREIKALPVPSGRIRWLGSGEKKALLKACKASDWDKAVKKAEISNFRFHDLRHTCASYLAQNGATLLQIADVLGHKQLEVTKRYSHLCVDHKQSLVDRVLGGVL
jgi:integrase